MNEKMKSYIIAVIMTTCITIENYFFPNIYYSFSVVITFLITSYCFTKSDKREKITLIQFLLFFIIIPIILKTILIQLNHIFI